jgi:diphthamide biosynthesis methyltransferase
VEIITIRTPIYGMWCLEMFRLTYPLFYRYIIKNNSYSNDVLKNIERQFHTTQLFNMKDLKDSERWNV